MVKLCVCAPPTSEFAGEVYNRDGERLPPLRGEGPLLVFRFSLVAPSTLAVRFTRSGR